MPVSGTITEPEDIYTPMPLPTLDLIGVGTTADDDTGDTIRDSYIKTNDNFAAVLVTLAKVAPAGWAIPAIATTNQTATIGSTLFRLDATSGDLTLTLPNALGALGQCIEIAKWDSSSNDVIADPAGTDALYGTTGIITTQYDVLRLRSVGDGWLKV